MACFEVVDAWTISKRRRRVLNLDTSVLTMRNTWFRPLLERPDFGERFASLSREISARTLRIVETWVATDWWNQKTRGSSHGESSRTVAWQRGMEAHTCSFCHVVRTRRLHFRVSESPLRFSAWTAGPSASVSTLQDRFRSFVESWEAPVRNRHRRRTPRRTRLVSITICEAV